MGQARECLGQGPSSCSLVPPGLQEQVTAAVAHAVEQQMQKLLEETQLDMNEFDNLLQPIIDTCTKDAISVRVGGGLVGADPRLRGSFGARLGSGQYTGKVRRSTGREGDGRRQRPCAVPHLPRACALWPEGHATCSPSAWLLQAGKNWMFSNAKSPPHCELMAGHLRNRITADGAHFELRLHLIYLINDVLHHWVYGRNYDGI